MTRRLQRRTVLLAGAAAVAGLVARPARTLAQGQRLTGDVALAATRLARVYTSPESARAIGRIYLHDHPEEADAARLLNHLSAREPALRAEALTGDRESTRTVVAATVKRDFAERRTIRVDGWILSETEVKLCALATLA